MRASLAFFRTARHMRYSYALGVGAIIYRAERLPNIRITVGVHAPFFECHIGHPQLCLPTHPSISARNERAALLSEAGSILFLERSSR